MHTQPEMQCRKDVVGGGERDEEDVRVHLERYIALVKWAVHGPSELMSHSNRGMRFALEVMISAKQTGTRPACMFGSIAMSTAFSAPPAGSAVTSSRLTSSTGVVASTLLPATPAPPENYTLEVNPLETIRSLKDRVMSTKGFGSRLVLIQRYHNIIRVMVMHVMCGYPPRPPSPPEM